MQDGAHEHFTTRRNEAGATGWDSPSQAAPSTKPSQPWHRHTITTLALSLPAKDSTSQNDSGCNEDLLFGYLPTHNTPEAGHMQSIVPDRASPALALGCAGRATGKVARVSRCRAARSATDSTTTLGWLFELQPELLEAVCGHLSLGDVSALASTCKAAAPLHSVRIALRVASLRRLTENSNAYLLALIGKLPDCQARQQILEVLDSAMLAFHRVCVCNEAFLQLSKVASMRGMAVISPVQAASHARCCCYTCDHVSVALVGVSLRLNDFVLLAMSSAEHMSSLMMLNGEADLGAQSDVHTEQAEQQPLNPQALQWPPLPPLPVPVDFDLSQRVLPSIDMSMCAD